MVSLVVVGRIPWPQPGGRSKGRSAPSSFVNHDRGAFGEARTPRDSAFDEGFRMNGAEVLDVGRDAIWLTIQLSAPVLIVGLLVGVGIGLLQALTQIQEQTLVNVPKILAVFVALLVFLPMMGALLGGFMHQIAARIAAM
jgi:flagellar biosynthetic protein FliQ